MKVERMGMFVRVTSPERTLAECLDRPEYGGGIEEVLRCLSSLPFLNEEVLKAYLVERGKKVLFAKVGWVLERLKERLSVSEKFLRWLKERSLKHPTLIGGGQGGERVFIKGWNLVVPHSWLSALEGVLK